jgi:hypothetical protein
MRPKSCSIVRSRRSFVTRGSIAKSVLIERCEASHGSWEHISTRAGACGHYCSPDGKFAMNDTYHFIMMVVRLPRVPDLEKGSF